MRVRDRNGHDPPRTTMTTSVLDLTGMTCAGCARRIERALRAVDGVAAAEVNFATQQARVEFDAGKVSGSALAAAVEEAGFGVLRPTAQATGRFHQRDGAAAAALIIARKRSLRSAAVARAPVFGRENAELHAKNAVLRNLFHVKQISTCFT